MSTIRVTYTDGETEDFQAEDTAIADRNSQTLVLRNRLPYGGGYEIVATLVLVNIRKWVVVR